MCPIDEPARVYNAASCALADILWQQADEVGAGLWDVSHDVRDLRCLIPRFDGAILSLEWKEAVWDKFVMGAPRLRTPSEQQYSDRKLRSRR